MMGSRRRRAGRDREGRAQTMIDAFRGGCALLLCAVASVATATAAETPEALRAAYERAVANDDLAAVRRLFCNRQDSDWIGDYYTDSVQSDRDLDYTVELDAPEPPDNIPLDATPIGRVVIRYHYPPGDVAERGEIRRLSTWIGYAAREGGYCFVQPTVELRD